MQAPVLILGASGTLGGAIAHKLHGAGQPVILHANTGVDRIASLAAECGAAPVVSADLTDEDQVTGLFDDLAGRHGALSGLVLSVARPFPNKLTHRTPWDVFQAQIDSQLKAAHLVLSAAQPLLKAHGATDTARVLVISTEFALSMPPVKVAPYVAAKAALTAYAKVIAQEWLVHNIRVHIMAPGMVKSELTADLPDMYLEQVADAMPEKRLTSSDDVADVAAFLMSPAANSLYGTVIPVTRNERP